jgi:hypothetical protein
MASGWYSHSEAARVTSEKTMAIWPLGGTQQIG